MWTTSEIKRCALNICRYLYYAHIHFHNIHRVFLANRTPMHSVTSGVMVSHTAVCPPHARESPLSGFRVSIFAFCISSEYAHAHPLIIVHAALSALRARECLIELIIMSPMMPMANGACCDDARAQRCWASAHVDSTVNVCVNDARVNQRHHQRATRTAT